MKRLAGVLAGAALIGGLALAQQDSTPSTTGSTKSSSGTAGTGGPGIGGSGLNQDQSTLNQQATKQAAVPGQATGQIAVGERTGNQLLGTVVESKSHTLYLQHMGAVVPLRVDKNTDLAGLSGKKLSDLKAGDEVQVSFQVKNKIDNVATKISAPSSAGTGGSGLGASEESRRTSGSAGMSKPGEDTNVGKPVYPEEQPVKQPADPGLKRGTEDEKPLY
ncbi:MAG TPA: hypothetical protein VFA20_31700 [Myxococcaceae bacterium]|nr:hypothetical protein [Myxococcaceae bacterium]